MATIWTGLSIGDTLDLRRFDFGRLLQGDWEAKHRDAFAVDFGRGREAQFTGHDLVFDEDGLPVSGTVTGFSMKQGGDAAWKMTGLKVDAALVARAIETEWRADDDKLMATMLRGNDRFVGGAGDDRLNGFGGNDQLIGNKGDDRLCGGAGKDVMMGGIGYDTFVFDAKLDARTNVDVITDFRSGRDTIALDNAVFKGLKNGGSVGLGDKIIYDSARHDLYFDRDGASSDEYKPVKFAHLAGDVQVHAGDFLVI